MKATLPSVRLTRSTGCAGGQLTALAETVAIDMRRELRSGQKTDMAVIGRVVAKDEAETQALVC